MRFEFCVPVGVAGHASSLLRSCICKSREKRRRWDLLYLRCVGVQRRVRLPTLVGYVPVYHLLGSVMLRSWLLEGASNLQYCSC